MPLSTKEAGSPRGRSDDLVTIPAGSSQASRRGGRMLINIVIPSSLFIILGALIAICVIALGMMVRVVSKPSISQTLRLNED